MFFSSTTEKLFNIWTNLLRYSTIQKMWQIHKQCVYFKGEHMELYKLHEDRHGVRVDQGCSQV